MYVNKNVYIYIFSVGIFQVSKEEIQGGPQHSHEPP